ncbi:MAG: energy transducer TonB [Bacteroidota bacterium]|nr:energy transducer TonB [Bacteroidota bacterium]
MVLNNEQPDMKCMWKWILALSVLPFNAVAQNGLQGSTEAHQVKLLETSPITVTTAENNRINAMFRSEGKKFFLRLMGTGKAAHTINTDDQTIFLLENDSTVTMKATSVQGYNDYDSVRSFSHEYVLHQSDIEMLSRNKVRAFRKYSVIGFDEFYLDEPAAANLKSQSIHFLQVLDKEKLLKKVVITEPSFPGGKEAFLQFINTNLKQLPVLRTGERKTAEIQFETREDGSIEGLQVKQSAGVVFDNELLRIFKRMPRWKSALADGSPINRIVNLQVRFYQDAERVKATF